MKYLTGPIRFIDMYDKKNDRHVYLFGDRHEKK